MNNFVTLNLEEYFCNKGFSFSNRMDEANFTGIGSSYPAELMPQSEVIDINNIPFIFPTNNSKFDNMEFNRQVIKFEHDSYESIHFLGAADNGSFEEELILSDGDNYKTVTLGFTNWLEQNPIFGEEVAINFQYMHTKSGKKIEELSPKIWFNKVEIQQSTSVPFFNSITFPDNPGMHIFGITLKKRG